jgi:hypothetical protein
MDPYLERFWNDVHGSLITYIKDELNAALPPRFRATLQDRVVIADLEQPFPGVRYPDVAVLEAPRLGAGGTAVHSAHLLIQAPEILTYPGDPLTEYSVEIVDTKSGDQVVTAIEVLSPENKRTGDGLAKFQQKQKEYRDARVNRVEIDLLREGRRLYDFPTRLLSADWQTPYYVTVYRGGKPNQCDLYPIGLREALPVIGVPLRETDPDVPLDLQPLIEHVYRTGRFPIDYREPCDPPLEGPDAEWSKTLLARGSE